MTSYGAAVNGASPEFSWPPTDGFLGFGSCCRWGSAGKERLGVGPTYLHKRGHYNILPAGDLLRLEPVVGASGGLCCQWGKSWGNSRRDRLRGLREALPAGKMGIEGGLRSLLPDHDHLRRCFGAGFEASTRCSSRFNVVNGSVGMLFGRGCLRSGRSARL